MKPKTYSIVLRWLIFSTIVAAAITCPFVTSSNARREPKHSVATVSSRGDRSSENFLRALSINEGETIKAFHLLSNEAGWVLTDKELLWTNDGGNEWKDITPQAVDSSEISAVFFISETTGWLISTSVGTTAQDAVTVRVGVTNDGGNHWLFADLSTDERISKAYAGRAFIDFVDPLNGWVMIKLSSSSNFSRGVLLRTEDGGRNWTILLPPPLGDPIRFVNPTDGWLAGGPAGNQLYSTRDGGISWTAKHLEPETTSRIQVDLPQFQK